MNNCLDFRASISFGYTARYLSHKTQTRREWKDSHAAKFTNAYDRAIAAGQQLRVLAIDKGYYAGGKQIGWCVLTRRPFKERLANMSRHDLREEGVPCTSVEEFISKYFKGDKTLEVWVISFKYIPLPEEYFESSDPTNLPSMPLNAVPPPNPSLKVFGSSKSDEHNTPKFLIDAARAIMGGIDLDPMSNAIANRTVRAHRIFTKADDGLAKPWLGRVWLNPPFSLADRAVPKLIASYESGDVFEAVLLLKSAVETKRYQLLYDYPFVELNKRVNYTAPGNKDGAPFATVLFYLGTNFTRWREVMSAYGRIHLGHRLTEELELENLRLSRENSILRSGDTPVLDVPGLLHCGKCGGHGCEECDLGWSRATNWAVVAKAYEAAFDPNNLPPWMEVFA
jgi:DNA N-6-adenine-methyltransferase (Dam)